LKNAGALRDQSVRMTTRLHFFKPNNSSCFLRSEFLTPGPWSDTAGFIFFSSRIRSLCVWAESFAKRRIEKSPPLKTYVGDRFQRLSILVLLMPCEILLLDEMLLLFVRHQSILPITSSACLSGGNTG